MGVPARRLAVGLSPSSPQPDYRPPGFPVQSLTRNEASTRVWKYVFLNTKNLAARIDTHHILLSQYLSETKMPSEEQTKKIITGIRKVAKELSAVSLVARH